MDQGFKSFLKNAVLALGLFSFFSIPAFIVDHSLPTETISLSYPSPGRQPASTAPGIAEVAQKQCEVKTRWRYRCDENKKNCYKDRQVSYLDCQSL